MTGCEGNRPLQVHLFLLPLPRQLLPAAFEGVAAGEVEFVAGAGRGCAENNPRIVRFEWDRLDQETKCNDFCAPDCSSTETDSCNLSLVSSVYSSDMSQRIARLFRA